MSTIQNGVTPLKMVASRTSGSMPLRTKTLSPTGGVIRLISVTTTITMPNQISTMSGSIMVPKSSACTSG